MKRFFTISVSVLFLFLFITPALAQNVTVKGKVTDPADHSTLVGVSVSVKGTTTGTQTDVNGNYSISAPSNATLVFSYIGYTSQNVPVNGQTTINIGLNSSANQLQQVVVIGYGTQKKIDNTGAIATVKGSDIAKQASENPISGLQGKVAGVEIINSGQPGSAPTINIRGIGTVFGNAQPLFIVDGVWYNSIDDISFLNPSDIESLSVLKDASSEAIFGIRAANGVVLITTKRGKAGKPTINYNAYVGWQSVTNQVKMADGAEYATMINELYTDNNIIPAFSSNPASYGTGTNWYDQILRNAFVTNHQISLNGGTDKYTYNYSFGYLDQDGIIKTNNYQRYTGHISGDWKVVKNLKIGYTFSVLSSGSDDVDPGIYHQLYTAAPIVPVFYNTGKYGDPADYNVGGGANYNPEATIDFYHQHSKTHEFTGNIYGEYTIIKDLVFKTSLGGELAQAEARHFTPIYDATAGQQSNVSTLDLNHNEDRNWIWENTLTYNKTIGKHHITALMGEGAQHNENDYADATAKNVPFDQSGNLHTSFPSGTTVTYTKATGTGSPNYLHTEDYWLWRINYSYADRYLINASERYDGASEFYPQQIYGWFPSIGAGWVISNEDFMKNQHFFNTLKLRASFGRVGNANVTQVPGVQLVTTDPGQYTAVFGNPPTTAAGASINTISRPTGWEIAQSSDFGIEGSILDDHLSFEAEYYDRLTLNAIFPIPVLGSIGESGPNGGLLSNQANIQNKGFEFLLSWKQQVNKDFYFSLSPNLSINTNEVTKVISGNIPLYGGGNGVTNGALATRTIVGQPIGEFYGYKVTGIYQTSQQIASGPASGVGTPQAGDFIYQDTNGDHSITSTDRVNLGNPNAKYYYGVNTYFKYKEFDLELDFQGRADVSIYNANLAYRFGNENFTQDFYDNRWHGQGTSNTYPSVNIGSTYDSAPNSFYVTSGAYFRLRNAQLGYTLPQSITGHWGIRSLRVYANAQNAINIFGYKGFSPEVGGAATGLGIDANVYPLYATYNFGVNVTF
ncbi:MAG TPA: TonB-dependent receptor [Mucilaginibacter sp.]|jgi:TonB-linked SusC/RagA family outer membrane protein|nr:TonB-dependent receptor [Mucilaginibacter sp.]